MVKGWDGDLWFHSSLFHGRLFHARLFHARIFHGSLFHGRLFRCCRFARHTEEKQNGLRKRRGTTGAPTAPSNTEEEKEQLQSVGVNDSRLPTSVFFKVWRLKKICKVCTEGMYGTYLVHTSYIPVHTSYIPVHTPYIPRTYLVHTCTYL